MKRLQIVFRAVAISNLLSLIIVGMLLLADVANQLTGKTAVFLLIFSSTISTLVALLCCLLRYSFNRREIITLSLLLSLMLAALLVLNGDYTSQSRQPLLIYAIALSNSLLVASVITAVFQPNNIPFKG